MEVTDWCDRLGSTILPALAPAELQKLFDEVPAVNGKKATAWVEKILFMGSYILVR